MPDAPPIPFVLDTDIGDNVDDALALALACRSRELRFINLFRERVCSVLRIST